MEIPIPEEEKPFLSEEDIKLLKEGTLKDFNESDQNFFLHVCQKNRLHPLMNQIWARPENDQRNPNGTYKKMLIIVGIQGFLTIADRSGVYDGSDPIQWCGKNGEWTDIWLQNETPAAARAATWRKDHSRPEVSVVRYNAVKAFGPFWQKAPDYMMGKCALAASLRKLFPNQLSGLYETSEIADAGPSDVSMSVLEKDIEDQKKRIAESEAATKRAVAEGATIVTETAEWKAGEGFRDPVKEVEPAFPADKAKLGQQAEELSDDIDMTPNTDGRPKDWWRTISCNPVGNNYYNGKTVEELSLNLLKQAVERWVPKVRAKGQDARKDFKDCADAMELGLAEAEKVQGQLEARKAAQAAEGRQ